MIRSTLEEAHWMMQLIKIIQNKANTIKRIAKMWFCFLQMFVPVCAPIGANRFRGGRGVKYVWLLSLAPHPKQTKAEAKTLPPRRQ